ncbi:recombinase family protein [Bifidobacterium bombi]|nr:recombinase family protein [Bifidobacterium bombi]
MTSGRTFECGKDDMKSGYIRVSTARQADERTSLDSQKKALLDAGVAPEHIYDDAVVSEKQ